MLEFLMLTEHHETVTIEMLGHDLVWSILKNFTKLDLLTDDELAKFKAELVNGMADSLLINSEKKEVKECSVTTSTQVH